MELNSNVIVAIVTIVLCALALTYAMLTVQKSLNAIVCYIKLIANSQAANKTKASGQTEHMRMSTSQKFKAMIIPAALLVLAFCVNNIDKFVDFISPDPIEETNKKLAQIVEGMQPSIQVDLPDSLESTTEVRQIRKFQDEILYFKLYVKRIKSLYENYNNEERILNDKEVVINNISLLTVLVQTNDAYGKAIRTSTSTMLSRVSSKCDVYSVQYAQRKGDEYGKMLVKHSNLYKIWWEKELLIETNLKILCRVVLMKVSSISSFKKPFFLSLRFLQIVH